MEWSKIYDYFLIKLDNDNFDGEDDDALKIANVAYRIILGEKPWNFLKTSANLLAGTNSLSGITNFDRLLRVWAVISSDPTDNVEMKKANFEERFNPQKDYWLDIPNNKIELIGNNNQYANSDKIVDYLYKPSDITASNSPKLPDFAAFLISLHMIKIFKQADQDYDFYSIHGAEYEELMNKLIDYNESLVDY